MTINVGETNAIPKCPIKGHTWKNVISNTEATWLLSYKDEESNFEKKDVKYVYLAPDSKIKVANDIKKYERAKRLYKIIDQIWDKYFKEIVDDRETRKQ